MFNSRAASVASLSLAAAIASVAASGLLPLLAALHASELGLFAVQFLLLALATKRKAAAVDETAATTPQAPHKDVFTRQCGLGGFRQGADVRGVPVRGLVQGHSRFVAFILGWGGGGGG